MICHQVVRSHPSVKLLDALARDPAKDFVTFPNMGTVVRCSLPFTLAEADAQGAGKAGRQRVVPARDRKWAEQLDDEVVRYVA